MTTLHLILKKQWFDLIESGVKKEEYRDITPHYASRICNDGNLDVFRPFDVVVFQLGYQTDAKRMTVECKGIDYGTGKPEWGAEPGKRYFVIKLGEILK